MPVDQPVTDDDSSSRRRLGRLLGAAQAVLGWLLITRPEQLAAMSAGPKGKRAPRWLVRVLGLRSLIQGVITAVRPTDTVLAGGALVDATHAVSMLPLIVSSPRYRRAAAISTLTAAASAGAGAFIPRADTSVRKSAA